MNRTELKREMLDAVGRGRPDAGELVDELVDDWQREAGDGADAPAILALLRREFLDQAAARDEARRHDLLLEHMLDRRIRRASVRSWELGRRVVDGTIAADQARDQGEALMNVAKDIAPRIRELADAEVVARLQRDLQEVTLEALYAIERKAMSRRLDDYRRDVHAPSPNVGSPHVS